MKIKNYKFIALLLPCLFIFQSCLSDLRSKDQRVPELYTEASKVKALEILNRYAQRSGIETWESITTYEVDFVDDFFGFLGQIAKPFPDKKNQFRLRYEKQVSRGSLFFKNGKNKGKIWGYDEGTSYTQENIRAPKVVEKNKKITFWVPTYQYFIEFPIRIMNADIIYHVGEKKYGLDNYDLILVSWKSPAPQRKLDQYLIWVNQSTGLVDKLQYTIRDQGAMLKGTAIIDEYISYDGIQIPSLFKVYLRENSTKPLHIMRVYNFRSNRFDKKELMIRTDKNDQK